VSALCNCSPVGKWLTRLRLALCRLHPHAQCPARPVWPCRCLQSGRAAAGGRGVRRGSSRDTSRSDSRRRGAAASSNNWRRRLASSGRTRGCGPGSARRDTNAARGRGGRRSAGGRTNHWGRWKDSATGGPQLTPACNHACEAWRQCTQRAPQRTTSRAACKAGRLQACKGALQSTGKAGSSGGAVLRLRRHMKSGPAALYCCHSRWPENAGTNDNEGQLCCCPLAACPPPADR
jgi:hypothetical protein